jgi:glutamate-1-semialdehyde 2,1-aminomutase
MVQAPVKQSILADYEEHFAGSMALYGRARNIIAGGITHDGRYIKPFPLYVKRAQGGHKWDVDGHKLVDFAMGHGALILGHGDPDVTAAVAAQLTNGTHHGAGHEAHRQKRDRQVPGPLPRLERLPDQRRKTTFRR